MQGSRVRRCKTDRVTRQASLEETRHQIENDSTTGKPCWCATMVDCSLCHDLNNMDRSDDDETLVCRSTMGCIHLNHPTVNSVDSD